MTVLVNDICRIACVRMAVDKFSFLTVSLCHHQLLLCIMCRYLSIPAPTIAPPPPLPPPAKASMALQRSLHLTEDAFPRGECSTCTRAQVCSTLHRCVAYSSTLRPSLCSKSIVRTLMLPGRLNCQASHLIIFCCAQHCFNTKIQLTDS